MSNSKPSPSPNGEDTERSFAVVAEDAAAAVDERVRSLDEWVRTLVVERPFVAVAAALAGGYLIGRLASR
jgi:ElaB/YqjD/DUF883 family membrane-anchored ribosome-binding protein